MSHAETADGTNLCGASAPAGQGAISCPTCLELLAEEDRNAPMRGEAFTGHEGA